MGSFHPTTVGNHIGGCGGCLDFKSFPAGTAAAYWKLVAGIAADFPIGPADGHYPG